jgi:hypothetical protein
VTQLLVGTKKGLFVLEGEPGALLGAIQSDEQRALLPSLEATVAVVVGVVDHVMDEVGTKLISSYGMLTEALRRRRVETADADRLTVEARDSEEATDPVDEPEDEPKDDPKDDNNVDEEER